MDPRITINPLVRFGKPCVRNTRISISDILSLITGGYSIEDIPRQYPELSKEDVIAAIEYACHSLEHPTEIISPS